MTDENIVDLFLAKFKTSPKEKQEGLVKYLIQSTYNQDQIVDYLNGKKITVESKNITEGNYVTFKIDVDTWPRFNRQHYIDKNLVDDKGYIRGKVVAINPINNNIFVELIGMNGEMNTYLMNEYNFEKQISQSDLLLDI